MSEGGRVYSDYFEPVGGHFVFSAHAIAIQIFFIQFLVPSELPVALQKIQENPYCKTL